MSSQFWKTLVPEGTPNRRYEILQEIASGGMATVYLGSQRGLDGFERVVALKRALPPRDGVDPSMHLRREARLASRVQHPYVVSVIDVAVVDSSMLLVMEYVEGASLAQLLMGGPLTPRVLARILLDACAGLQAVHEAKNDDGEPWGLGHRDVSPQNLLVGTDGTTRVIDFGIATARGSSRTTANSARRGKPGYMSPTYLSAGIATPACDVFALGVIAWECLTGRRLYAGATSVEAVSEMHDTPIPPPWASPSWDSCVMQTIGRTTEPRFRSAAELERALLRACEADVAERDEVAAVVEDRAREALWLRRAIVRERLRRSHPDVPDLNTLPSTLPERSERRLTQDDCETVRIDSREAV